MMPIRRIECGSSAAAGDDRREWLVTNGSSAYASGTIAGIVTRRYHGLLVAALPSWPYSRSWGYHPSGLLGLVVVVLVVLMLTRGL